MSETAYVSKANLALEGTEDIIIRGIVKYWQWHMRHLRGKI